MDNLVIEQRRGFAVEGEHPIDAVIATRDGAIVAQIGRDEPTTFRSAAKPFQLETSLSLLPEAARAALTSRDLALGAASHHGESMHVAQVESLLARLGRGAEHLYCGVHPPSHAPSAQALWARGEEPSVLHNNCSGKHAFMAAASAAQRWAEDYRSPMHGLQQHALSVLQARTGGGIAGTVVDGCGLPCFVLSLSAMARAWAELAHALAHEPQTHLGSIGLAMREHPLLMSGTEAFDGWLIQHSDAVAKVGAQGLLCLALPQQAVGIAIKVRSGSDVVRPKAALAVLERVFPGWLQAATPARFVQVFNLVGAQVGAHAAVWQS
jgi:L-asparaginase II